MEKAMIGDTFFASPLGWRFLLPTLMVFVRTGVSSRKELPVGFSTIRLPGEGIGVFWNLRLLRGVLVRTLPLSRLTLDLMRTRLQGFIPNRFISSTCWDFPLIALSWEN